MGDRVAVMNDGILQQVDTPQELYDGPVNVFVAGFIGSPAMNLVRGGARAEQRKTSRSASASTSWRSTISSPGTARVSPATSARP